VYCCCGHGFAAIEASDGLHHVHLQEGDTLLIPAGTQYSLANDSSAAILQLVVLWGPCRPASRGVRAGSIEEVAVSTAGILHSHIPSSPAVVQERYKDGTGSVTQQGLFNITSAQESTLQLWTLPEGASEGIHIHGGTGSESARNKALVKAPLEEIYFCVSGTGCVPIEDLEGRVHMVPLQEGDAVIAPAGVWHGVSNVGASPLRVLVVLGTPCLAKAAEDL